MSEKFRNLFRIPSARAPWWDYKNPGLYFITICTYGHECVFGKIVDGNMVLSPIGKIMEEEWHKSFEIRTELFCDSFVIMPNHIDAILRIALLPSPYRRTALYRRTAVRLYHHPSMIPPYRRTAVRLYRCRCRCDRRNRYHHLWPDLNPLLPHESINIAGLRNYRCGRRVSMIISSAMMANINVSISISGIIL